MPDNPLQMAPSGPLSALPAYNSQGLAPSQFVNNGGNAALAGIGNGLDLAGIIGRFGPALKADNAARALQAKQALSQLDMVDDQHDLAKKQLAVETQKADMARTQLELEAQRRSALHEALNKQGVPDVQQPQAQIGGMAQGALSGIQPPAAPSFNPAAFMFSPLRGQGSIVQGGAQGQALSTPQTTPAAPLAQGAGEGPLQGIQAPQSNAGPLSYLTDKGIEPTLEEYTAANSPMAKAQLAEAQNKATQSLSLADQEKARAMLIQTQAADAAAGKPWRGQPDDWKPIGIDEQGQVVTQNQKTNDIKTLPGVFNYSKGAAASAATLPLKAQNALLDEATKNGVDSTQFTDENGYVIDVPGLRAAVSDAIKKAGGALGVRKADVGGISIVGADGKTRTLSVPGVDNSGTGDSVPTSAQESADAYWKTIRRKLK